MCHMDIIEFVYFYFFCSSHVFSIMVMAFIFTPTDVYMLQFGVNKGPLSRFEEDETSVLSKFSGSQLVAYSCPQAKQL